MIKTTCSKCEKPLDRENQRYCLSCHAAACREWRKRNQLTPEQSKKDKCRSISRLYLRRGMLLQNVCQHCGKEKAERHHPSYDHPKVIIWLCRPHHLALHRGEIKVPLKLANQNLNEVYQ